MHFPDIRFCLGLDLGLDGFYELRFECVQSRLAAHRRRCRINDKYTAICILLLVDVDPDLARSIKMLTVVDPQSIIFDAIVFVEEIGILIK
jgi:hypothetical protein